MSDFSDSSYSRRSKDKKSSSESHKRDRDRDRDRHSQSRRDRDRDRNRDRYSQSHRDRHRDRDPDRNRQSTSTSNSNSRCNTHSDNNVPGSSSSSTIAFASSTSTASTSFTERDRDDHSNRLKNGHPPQWSRPHTTRVKDDSHDIKQSSSKPIPPFFPKEEEDSHSERDDILNIFQFANKDVELPAVVEEKRNLGDLGAPPPKIPRTASYNLSDNLNYLEDIKIKIPPHTQVIKQHSTNEYGNSDSDSNSDADDSFSSHSRSRNVPQPTLSTLEDVFVKYDFTKRSPNSTFLPIYMHKEHLISGIEKNRIVIIEGATGCGKTTQVPQYLIDYHFDKKRRCNIMVTQPRRLATMSLARRVCEERGWDLGSVVGYHIGMEEPKVSPDTLVTYVTTGVLLQKLISTKSLRNFTHVIIDEVHERDLETDLLLLLIKKILIDDVKGKEKHVKLILMSATLKADKFSKYFLIQKSSRRNREVSETPVIKVPTSTPFRIEEFFLDDIAKDEAAMNQVYDTLTQNWEERRANILPDLYNYAVKAILDLDKLEERERNRRGYSNPGNFIPGSVLVFLPGIQEMKELQRKLDAKNKSCLDSHGRETDEDCLKILLFHSTSTKEDQRKVFDPPKQNQRKIILATNIAESSITIPDIIYVMDFCLTKSNCVDPRTNFNSLRTCWASISQCTQRKGRTGRVRDGRVYRLVPKKFFNKLDADTVPDMLKSSLEYVVLKIKMLGSGSPKELMGMALDPPKQSGIERAVVNLKECGGLKLLTTKKQTHYSDDRKVERYYDSCDGDLTHLGEIMAHLPVSIQCTRLIMLGHCFGVLKEAIIIAAGLSSTKNPFHSPEGKHLEAYLEKMRWAQELHSDCIATLRAYRGWENEQLKQQKADHLYNWARTVFVHVGQMREMQRLIEDITKRLTKDKLLSNVSTLSGDSTSKSKSNEHVAANEVSKTTALFLKVAIAGAFYPNYFIPGDLPSEREIAKSVDGMNPLTTVYYSKFPNDRIGPLYAQTISNELAYVNSYPRIKFSGQNIFVNFNNFNKSIGPIPEDLFRILKKRNLRQKLELKLLSKNEEERVYSELTRKRREERRNILFSPHQIAPPSIETKSISVIVTNVESPSKFWVIESMKHEIRNEIHKVINQNLLHIPISPTSSKLVVNALVVAKQSDKYSRARVEFVDRFREQALIYFIDYGKSKWIPISHLQPFPPVATEVTIYDRFTAANYPGLAMECTLHNIRPAVMYSSVWPGKARALFRKLIDESRSIDLFIYAVCESIIYCEFIAHFRQPPPSSSSSRRPSLINFNVDVKKENFADDVPETEAVMEQRRARKRLDLMQGDHRQIASCNAEQVADTLDLDFLDSPMYGQVHCKLEGPFSPIEVRFRSLCESTRLKEVDVDRSSVNSVCFEHQPSAPTSRLLVASTINIQENSGVLTARETTMMPGVPGFGALASLLFTPKAELRTDYGQTKYTGALCGLGFEDRNGDIEPIYKDHDLEIIFDANIEDEDIEMINRIRSDMSMILRKSDGTCIDAVRIDLKKYIIMLLKKPRDRLSKDKQMWPRVSYAWNKISKESVRAPKTDSFEPLDVFEPHPMIKFKEGESHLSNDLLWDFGG